MDLARSQHSCVTQLLSLVEDLSYALDQQKQIDVILLDFDKAFDSVSHQKLLSKLRHSGIKFPQINHLLSVLLTSLQILMMPTTTSYTTILPTLPMNQNLLFYWETLITPMSIGPLTVVPLLKLTNFVTYCFNLISLN